MTCAASVAGIRRGLRPTTITRVPTFYLGLLCVAGQEARGEFTIPFATTEADLPTGVQRGILALNRSGGCRTSLIRDAMTRCPVFRAASAAGALQGKAHIEAGMPSLQALCQETSSHLSLQGADIWVFGRYLLVRFRFGTADAMGMNTATIASASLAQWVEANTPAKLVSLSSNVCADKKAAGINFALGRGKSVVAEATIPARIVRSVLHVTPQAIAEINRVKHLLGSAIALAPGYLTSHVANVVAAVFLATGQDLAQVVESSMGVFLAEVERDGALHVSLTLPCLEVGVVGGGTSEPYARRALRTMGCCADPRKPGSAAKRFAEIVSAACLAGEVSLAACLAEGTLGEVTAKCRRRRLHARRASDRHR